MNSKSRATFEFVKTGQQRAYGDTITEGILTVEMAGFDGEWRLVTVGTEQAKRMARGFTGWSDQVVDPFATRLESFESVGEGQYKVVTRARYND